VGLAIDAEGLPIFHRVFRGNIHGGTTLPLFIECLKNAGIRRCTLVLDRGFFSKENVDLVRRSRYSLIVGAPLRGELKNLMKRGKPSMRETVLLGSTYFYVKGIRWNGGKLVLCYNELEAVSVKNLVLRGKRKRRDPELIGCHALFSSDPELSEAEIVKRYFEKDIIEKTFRVLKSVLGLGPVRHWLQNRVNGHLYVCYLAYLLLALLQRKLVDKDIPVLQALDELKYVYKVITKEGVEKLVATTKTQKKVLRLLGVKLL
jgi:transposase